MCVQRSLSLKQMKLSSWERKHIVNIMHGKTSILSPSTVTQLLVLCTVKINRTCTVQILLYEQKLLEASPFCRVQKLSPDTSRDASNGQIWRSWSRSTAVAARCSHTRSVSVSMYRSNRMLLKVPEHHCDKISKCQLVDWWSGLAFHGVERHSVFVKKTKDAVSYNNMLDDTVLPL